MTRFSIWMTGLAVSLVSAAAYAGTGGNNPGGGGGGGDGAGGGAPEPEIIALMIFSLIPGIYFARKAVATQRAQAQSR